MKYLSNFNIFPPAAFLLNIRIPLMHQAGWARKVIPTNAYGSGSNEKPQIKKKKHWEVVLCTKTQTSEWRAQQFKFTKPLLYFFGALSLIIILVGTKTKRKSPYVLMLRTMQHFVITSLSLQPIHFMFSLWTETLRNPSVLGTKL